MAREQLDTAAVAERLGISAASVRRYMMPDRAQYGFPPPDGYIGRSPWWWSTTIDKWGKTRPGKGAGGGRPPKQPEAQAAPAKVTRPKKATK